MNEIVKADTDGQYYRTQDLEWLVLPDEMGEGDPGVLGPVLGAIPVDPDLVGVLRGYG